MNTTPSSTPHSTSTTATDRPRSGQDQPQVDATRRVRAAGERALVLGGGGSTGNAWEIGLIAGLSDAGQRSGPSSEELAEIKQLKREKAELREANEILRAGGCRMNSVAA